MKTAIAKQMLEQGYRITEQRQKIIDILIENMERHMSIEDIYYYARTKGNPLSTATIYRTMRLLDDVGVVAKNSFGESAEKYELYIKEKKNHHHLICKECHKIIEISGELLDGLSETILSEKGFECEEMMLEVYGYCKVCKNKWCD